MLGAYGGLHIKDISNFLLVGELGLDGTLRAVQGMLPIAIAARAKGIKNLVIPASNAREAAVVEGVNVYPVHSLSDAAAAHADGDVDPGEFLLEPWYCVMRSPP